MSVDGLPLPEDEDDDALEDEVAEDDELELDVLEDEALDEDELEDELLDDEVLELDDEVVELDALDDAVVDADVLELDDDALEDDAPPAPPPPPKPPELDELLELVLVVAEPPVLDEPLGPPLLDEEIEPLGATHAPWLQIRSPLQSVSFEHPAGLLPPKPMSCCEEHAATPRLAQTAATVPSLPMRTLTRSSLVEEVPAVAQRRVRSVAISVRILLAAREGARIRTDGSRSESTGRSMNPEPARARAETSR